MYGRLLDEDTKEEMSKVAAEALVYKTPKSFAEELNSSIDEMNMLLSDLKGMKLISMNTFKGNRCSITPEGKTVFVEQRLTRQAAKLDEDDRKERLANRISIANVLIPIAAFLLPLVWAYFFQIEPLQKDRDKLKDTVKELRLKVQQLENSPKQKQ